MPLVFNVGIKFTPETKSFIDLGISLGYGALSNNQMCALERLVRLLKYYNLYNKLYAIYPFVGGNSGWHSLNLINKCWGQISWVGVITHDSGGITGNGTNGWGDTGLLPGAVSSVFIYSRTNISGNYADLSSLDSGNRESSIFAKNGASAYFDNPSNTGAGQFRPTIADSLGLIGWSRESNTLCTGYKNGNNIGANTNDVSALSFSTISFGILAQKNSGGASFFSPRNIAFCCLGKSLAAAEVYNLYAAIQSYQQALGRDV